jgi:hypothetical protein
LSTTIPVVAYGSKQIRFSYDIKLRHFVLCKVPELKLSCDRFLIDGFDRRLVSVSSVVTFVLVDPPLCICLYGSLRDR